MRPIKFRAWTMVDKKMEMVYDEYHREEIFEWLANREHGCEFMQYTGLLDKNDLTYIYEGDIIDKEGKIIGNQYENSNLLKEKSNLLIQGFGTKNWETTNIKAMERGCKYAK